MFRQTLKMWPIVCPLGSTHWSQMAGHIQNVLSMYLLGICGSHNRVYLKCTQHFITGHIGVTCWLWSQCFHYVPSGYLGPCPQCQYISLLFCRVISASLKGFCINWGGRIFGARVGLRWRMHIELGFLKNPFLDNLATLTCDRDIFDRQAGRVLLWGRIPLGRTMSRRLHKGWQALINHAVKLWPLSAEH